MVDDASRPVATDWREGAAAQVISLVVTSFAVVGAAVVFRRLNSIDNSAENFARHGSWMFWIGVLASAVAISLCAVNWNEQRDLVRRAVRVGLISCGANIVLFIAPCIFGMHRVGLFAFAMIGAGLLGVAALAPVVDARRRNGVERWPVWRGPLLTFCAFSAASGAMLMYKSGQLGWAFAMD